MKKILIVCLLAFLLVGCSKEANVSISNGSDVIYSTNKAQYTNNELFSSMKTQDYTSVVLAKILNVVAEKEAIDLSEVEAECEEEYEFYVAYGYESYITYYYGSKENFIKSLVQNVIAEKLMTKYADENMNEYVDQYKPYKAQIAYFEDMDVAKQMIEDVNNNVNTFEYAALNYGYENDCQETIYTDSSDLPLEVKEMALKAETTGILDIVTSSTVATDSEGNSVVTPRYYVINIINKDVEDFKDDFVQYIADNYLESANVINAYIQKYNVTVHDQRTYELLSAAYPGVKY